MRMKRTNGRDDRKPRMKKPARWQPPIATATQALERLTPLLSIIYALIEAGIAEGLNFFNERGTPINNVVFAGIVRLKVFEELEARTRDAGLTVVVQRKSNVGVRAVFNGSTIAIWKADKDGQLPACGESEQRQLFYRQDVLPMMYGSDAIPPKLAVLWERIGGVLSVKLVAPRGFSSLWTAGLIHWEIDVPHPAKSLVASTDHLSSDAEELDDVLKQKKTTVH